MSSIFDNEKNKNKCQKFTPADIVDAMLDMAGYTKDLSGKRILENSFGTGNILKAIVKRYIEDSLVHQIPSQIISKNISRDIYGIELDDSLYLNCMAAYCPKFLAAYISSGGILLKREATDIASVAAIRHQRTGSTLQKKMYI